MIDHAHNTLADRDESVLLAWPTEGNAGGFIQLNKASDWHPFVASLDIDARLPEIVRAKFARAQALYLLGRVDFSVVKAGKLAALIALKLALINRYGGHLSKTKRSFSALFKYMVDVDGLTDAQIPMVVRFGGTAPGQLTGETHLTLAERRNSLAHGDLFDGVPACGLLELVRDLINFAYWHDIAEAASLGVQPASQGPPR